MKTALVIAAHPDDEVLGCGGTIAKMADEGWDVHVLILAEGATSRLDHRDRELKLEDISELERCAQAAGKILGTRSVTLETFADNRMDGVEMLEVVKRIEQEIRRFRPERVLTHQNSDVNIDHRVVHDSVVAAVRPFPGAITRELLFFEVPSSTEWRPPASMRQFAPNMFVDISIALERKLEALALYKSELHAFPHPRSIVAVNHLARWRGASVGFEAAEAFEIGRLLA
jgi:LmbE family N-acetylglucosaminyl deacetylase